MALVPFSGEIDASTLPPGPAGPPGPPGPAGQAGPAGSASLTALTARVAALEAMLNGSARITHMLTLQGGVDLRYDSTPVPCANGMTAKRPYSAFIRFSDDNPANPLGGAFEILAHGPDDQCPFSEHDHICIYGPNAQAKNGRDHVVTIEAATAKNNWQPRISLGGGVHGAQVDLLDSALFRKDPTGAYQRDVLTSTSGNQHSLTSQAPLKPY